jgi:hypothetical protein
MPQPLTIEGFDAHRMQILLQQLKHDIAQLEAMLAAIQQRLAPDEDIFAEMAQVTANAPNADDSREAIYTRMPGE